MAATRKPLTFDVDRSPRTPAERPKRDNEQRQQVGARVTTTVYRQIKARAALQGVTVQTLVEQAIAEFLANHPG
jgi:predicted HicB family RNase H-like nuclease